MIMKQIFLVVAVAMMVILSSCGALGKSKCTECPEWTLQNLEMEEVCLKN